MKEYLKVKFMNILDNRWVLINRCDVIFCKSHVYQLKHTKDVSQEMSDRDKEMGKKENLRWDKVENTG